MGAGNVKAAYVVWASHLRDPAFRLLVFMAVTALDEDNPPQFSGGQETLAIGLGRRPPLTIADQRAIDRAMGQLRAIGAISRVQHSAPGSTARHQLNLSPDAARRVNKPISESDTRRHVTGEHPTHGGGDTRRDGTERPTRGDRTSDAARRTEENQEPSRLTDDEPITSSTPVETREPELGDEQVVISRLTGAERARAELAARPKAVGQ